MKVLVTGGAGFIGSNLVEELLNRGFSVRIIDNFSTGRKENIKEFENDIELIEGDIRSYHTVLKAVKGMDVIFHEAALPSVPRSIADPITSNEVNVSGTLNMLNASVETGVSKFVFASSSSVYGDTPELPKHENMIPNPLSPYAVSKLAGEKYCSVFARIYSLQTIALRYFNVFGPKQDPGSQYSAVIPKFIKAILSDKSPVIFGDGEQSRDFTFVKNVVNANILAATSESKSPLYANCACGDMITLNQLVSELNKLTNKNIRPVYEPDRSGDIKHSSASISKIKEELSYEPAVDFYSGLKTTLNWFLQNRQQFK